MAVLRSASKYSRTIVYAPFLNRIAPCPRTKSKRFENSFGTFYLSGVLVSASLSLKIRANGPMD
jgi:hypothetical protein